MIECTFKLNNEKTSKLCLGASSYSAFSGIGDHVNKTISQCIKAKGPIPKGLYYIIDRQSGGLLGPLRDLFNDKDEWFALYACDETIDDFTFCDEVKRGNFRIHPKGPLGISQGCVTIESLSDFKIIRSLLKGTEVEFIPNTNIECYGTLKVWS